MSASPKTEVPSQIVTTKSSPLVLVAQRIRQFFSELDFWAWAAILALPLAILDYFILMGEQALVDATVVLAEATMYLAAATFHGGRSQRLTNQKLEGILAILLEDGNDSSSAGSVRFRTDDSDHGIQSRNDGVPNPPRAR